MSRLDVAHRGWGLPLHVHPVGELGRVDDKACPIRQGTMSARQPSRQEGEIGKHNKNPHTATLNQERNPAADGRHGGASAVRFWGAATGWQWRDVQFNGRFQSQECFHSPHFLGTENGANCPCCAFHTHSGCPHRLRGSARHTAQQLSLHNHWQRGGTQQTALLKLHHHTVTPPAVKPRTHRGRCQPWPCRTGWQWG